jgi:DNA polymerase III sliding clamp (beta) subunit (PCNA family)
MRFTVNRKILYEAAKEVSKVAAINSALPELTGIMLQADSTTGELRLTCTNLEIMMERRIRNANVSEGGSMVLAARLISDMLHLLDGEDVTVTLYDDKIVEIHSGTATYQVSSLTAEKFPKPVIPFPEDTITITGLPLLAKRSVFAASTNASAQKSLQGVKLSFEKDGTYATATDSYRLVIAKTIHSSDGQLDMLIDQHALNVLCSTIKPDDEIYVGIAGKSVVMFKEDFIFSARLIEEKFIDINPILQGITNDFGAEATAKDLYQAIDSVNTITKMSDQHCMNLSIHLSCIDFSCESIAGLSKSSTIATNTNPTPENGFYYNPTLVLDFLKLISGKVTITINKQGLMMFYASDCQYLVLPRRKPTVKVEKSKPEKKPTPVKKSKKPAKAA